MKTDRVLLEQILDSINKIQSFTHGFDHEQFFDDQKTQSAVIMQLVLIGELAKKVSETTQQTIDLPWKEIKGFRNRAIHDYYQIDLDVVWTTIQDDLPTLTKTLNHALAK